MHSITPPYPALDSEIEFLQIHLEQAIWLPEELTVTLAKLDVISRPGAFGGGTLLANEKSAVNMRALEAQQELAAMVSKWAAVVRTACGVRSLPLQDTTQAIAAWMVEVEAPKRLALLPDFRRAYDELTTTIGNAVSIVDLPMIDDASVAPWLRIPVKTLDAIAAPAALTYALAGYGVEVTAMQIANWGKDGKLEVHLVELRGKEVQRQYCLGDVVDVWLEREEKRSRLAAKKAAAEAAKSVSVQVDLAVAA